LLISAGTTMSVVPVYFLPMTKIILEDSINDSVAVLINFFTSPILKKADPNLTGEYKLNLTQYSKNSTHFKAHTKYRYRTTFGVVDRAYKIIKSSLNPGISMEDVFSSLLFLIDFGKHLYGCIEDTFEHDAIIHIKTENHLIEKEDATEEDRYFRVDYTEQLKAIILHYCPEDRVIILRQEFGNIYATIYEVVDNHLKMQTTMIEFPVEYTMAVKIPFIINALNL